MQHLDNNTIVAIMNRKGKHRQYVNANPHLAPVLLHWAYQLRKPTHRQIVNVGWLLPPTEWEKWRKAVGFCIVAVNIGLTVNTVRYETSR